MRSTLNLLDCVRLGLHFLENTVDPQRGCLPFFVTIFKGNPAELRHDWPDFGDLTSRYVESFLLGRNMLGMSEPTETELRLRELFFSYFDEEDGLSYRPAVKEPYYSTIFRRLYNDHVAEVFDQGRVLHALGTWYQRTGEEALRDRANRLLQALNDRMIKVEDWGCFEKGEFTPDYTLTETAQPKPFQLYFAGSLIHSFTRCFEIFRSDLALDLAGRITKFCRYHSDGWKEDGSFICDKDKLSGVFGAVMDGHVHSRLAAIAGMTSVGAICGDGELVDWCKRSYDWFSHQYGSDFGWSPEFLGRYGIEAEGCETCSILDQMYCAIELARAGYHQYWNDLERIGRNQLLEQQFRNTSMVKNTVKKEDTFLSSFHNVGERIRGGFAGWAAPNDFIGNCEHHFCLMNCCGPSGMKAMYLLWDNIIRWENGVCTINVLMDRHTPEISITNRQPAEGWIELDCGTSAALRIRIPDWLDTTTLSLCRNGSQCNPAIVDGYLCVNCSPSDRLVLKYSMRDVIRNTSANGRSYNVRWIGDTVVSIDPPGHYLPLYNRSHLTGK